MDQAIAKQLKIGEALNDPLGHMLIHGYGPFNLGLLLMDQGDFFRRAKLALGKFFPGTPTDDIAESSLSEDERYWLRLHEMSQGAEMITDISRKSLPVQVQQFTARDLKKFDPQGHHYN